MGGRTTGTRRPRPSRSSRLRRLDLLETHDNRLDDHGRRSSRLRFTRFESYTRSLDLRPPLGRRHQSFSPHGARRARVGHSGGRVVVALANRSARARSKRDARMEPPIATLVDPRVRHMARGERRVATGGRLCDRAEREHPASDSHHARSETSMALGDSEPDPRRGIHGPRRVGVRLFQHANRRVGARPSSVVRRPALANGVPLLRRAAASRIVRVQSCNIFLR